MAEPTAVGTGPVSSAGFAWAQMLSFGTLLYRQPLITLGGVVVVVTLKGRRQSKWPAI